MDLIWLLVFVLVLFVFGILLFLMLWVPISALIARSKRFSIRDLLIFTAIVAVVVAIMTSIIRNPN